jgi:pantoate ligase/cytidylate kinase
VRLFTTVAGLRCYLKLRRSSLDRSVLSERDELQRRQHPIRIGLVPTMGALHAGHFSLIERSRQENDLVVVSIFVNPLQFGPQEDFQQYPRTLETDRSLCEAAGVDVIFAPTATELYGTNDLPDPKEVTQVIPPASMMAELCGRFRPGHFPGVTTVVTKLLTIVQPDRAYFGQKDAQQLAILKQMVMDLNLPVEVVGCPIIREPDGLAMSSRNQYLSSEERSQATALYRSLKQAEQAFQKGATLREELINVVKTELSNVPTIQPQYIELVHPDTMHPLEQVEDTGLLTIAAHVGSTRLIDNIVLKTRKPIVAIDGPAGAGKSTVARRVAQALGLLYLDTGAMYRAVTWLVLQSGISVQDEAEIAELVSQCEIVLASGIGGDQESERGGQSLDSEAQIAYSPNFNPQPSTPKPQPSLPTPHVWINGNEVTQAIRSQNVTAQVSKIAAQATVRKELVKQQQAYGRKGGIVMDGRDIGTHVFPDAEIKIFLTASVEERARRRQQDLQTQGQPSIALTELERTIRERDYLDSSREIAPLRKADDALEIQTDDLAIDEVVTKIVHLYEQKLAVLAGDRL